MEGRGDGDGKEGLSDYSYNHSTINIDTSLQTARKPMSQNPAY